MQAELKYCVIAVAYKFFFQLLANLLDYFFYPGRMYPSVGNQSFQG